jgi:monothiol glutaredoxin
MSITATIESIIASEPIVLFMKGNPAAPKCGFSASVVQVLGQLGVPYRSVDVLEDMTVREGIKHYSDWPTIPQLYVRGAFVGGCDIVREMYVSGELQTMLAEADAA